MEVRPGEPSGLLKTARSAGCRVGRSIKKAGTALKKVGIAFTVTGVLFSGVNATLGLDRACTMPVHALTVVDTVCERITK